MSTLFHVERLISSPSRISWPQCCGLESLNIIRFSFYLLETVKLKGIEENVVSLNFSV